MVKIITYSKPSQSTESHAKPHNAKASEGDPREAWSTAQKQDKYRDAEPQDAKKQVAERTDADHRGGECRTVE